LKDGHLLGPGAEGKEEMNEQKPDAETAQWLWFGGALLAMTIIALVVSLPRRFA
jgi:hypothetical protein